MRTPFLMLALAAVDLASAAPIGEQPAMYTGLLAVASLVAPGATASASAASSAASEAQPSAIAAQLAGVLSAAIALTVLIRVIKQQFPKLASANNAAATSVLAILCLQFGLGVDFFGTVESFQAFVSDSSHALFDGAEARALGGRIEVTDARVAQAADFAGRHAPFVAGLAASIGAHAAALRAALSLAGLALLLQGRRFIGEVIAAGTFLIALGALSVNDWSGPEWVRASLGPGKVRDPASAAGAALVAALAVRAFWQHSTMAWCAAVGWVAVNLAAALTLALAAHGSELLGLSDLDLRQVSLFNPLNADSWAALCARATDHGGAGDWHKVLWPSAQDVVVAAAAAAAGYACLVRGTALLRTLEDRTICRVLPDGVFQLLVPLLVLAPLYTGLAFCCLTHVATQKVSDAFQPAAALSRYAGAALRPDTAAHELVLSATPVGTLVAAFFQSGVAVHAFETAHYAQDKMATWITALAGATLVLAATLPELAPLLATPMPELGITTVQRYPLVFWAWLLLVRFGITHQLKNNGGGGGGGGGGSSPAASAAAAAPDTSNDEDMARALAAADAYGDAEAEGDGAAARAGVYSFLDSDDEESKSPVSPPTSGNRGRTMGAGGGSGLRRRRSKTTVRGGRS